MKPIACVFNMDSSRVGLRLYSKPRNWNGRFAKLHWNRLSWYEAKVSIIK